MIKVIVGNIMDRKTLIVNANTTLAAAISESGLDFSRGDIRLNGEQIDRSDLEKPFSAFGDCEMYSLSNIAHSKNA